MQIQDAKFWQSQSERRLVFDYITAIGQFSAWSFEIDQSDVFLLYSLLTLGYDLWYWRECDLKLIRSFTRKKSVHEIILVLSDRSSDPAGINFSWYFWTTLLFIWNDKIINYPKNRGVFYLKEWRRCDIYVLQVLTLKLT